MYTIAYSVPLLLDLMEEKQKVQVKVSEGVVWTFRPQSNFLG